MNGIAEWVANLADPGIEIAVDIHASRLNVA